MKKTNTLGQEINYNYIHEPESVKELEAILDTLREKSQSYAVTSTGNNWGYGCYASHDNSEHHISLKKLDRIKDFDRENGLITLEPGVTYSDVNKYLENNAPEWITPVHGGGPDCSVVGNAIERGYGITPIMDHFAACQSLKAILPNGGKYQSPLRSLKLESLSRSFRYGIGPYLDGIFTQSNFGIVTEMTIKLAQRSEAIEMFFLHFDHEYLEDAVRTIKKLKAKYKGTVGGINLMNKERMLSMTLDYPKERIEKRLPLDEEFVRKNAKELLMRDWNVVGAIYGPKEVVKATKKLIQKDLKVIKGRKMFISQSKVNFLDYVLKKLPFLFSENIKRSINGIKGVFKILNGKPDKVALNLAYWKNLSNKNVDNPTTDNCGLIWYAPLVEMTPLKVKSYVEFVKDVSVRFNITPLITLTTVDDLCFDSTVPIVFNKEDLEDQKRAHEYFDTLLEEGYQKGFYPYRFGTNSMRNFLEKLDPEYVRIVDSIKNTLDPQRLFAEGRYALSSEEMHRNEQVTRLRS